MVSQGEGDLLSTDDVDFALTPNGHDLLDREAAYRQSQSHALIVQLQAVRAILADPANFLIDDATCLARDAAGQRCGPASSDAVAWTWHGAVTKVAPPLAAQTAILDALTTADRGLKGGTFQASLGHADVLAAIDRAIILAQA